MVTIKAKGHEFENFTVKDTHSRRAQQFKNAILQTLKKIDLTEDYIDIPLERIAIKKMPATATWYFNGHKMYYRYASADNFAENLYIVSKVIEHEIEAVITEQKPIEEFITAFSEDDDIEEQRKQARELLGVSTDTKDLDLINQKYKVLAKEYHPDTLTGNIEKFKAINHAHKTLKRELE